MAVRRRSRWAAIVGQRCPRCLEGHVFAGAMRMYNACPECRVIYGRENGYFTGAMIVSYVLGVPILGLLALGVAYFTRWSPELSILVAGVLFVPLVPTLFRYSRVIWMHFDRMVDSNPESERYAGPPRVR
jgi:uncharacterized protein (DUF983 family)